MHRHLLVPPQRHKVVEGMAQAPAAASIAKQSLHCSRVGIMYLQQQLSTRTPSSICMEDVTVVLNKIELKTSLQQAGEHGTMLL